MFINCCDTSNQNQTEYQSLCDLPVSWRDNNCDLNPREEEEFPVSGGSPNECKVAAALAGRETVEENSGKELERSCSFLDLDVSFFNCEYMCMSCFDCYFLIEPELPDSFEETIAQTKNEAKHYRRLAYLESVYLKDRKRRLTKGKQPPLYLIIISHRDFDNQAPPLTITH